MFVHIFLLRWNDDANVEQKSKAIREIAAFEGTIPGLRDVVIGSNVSPRGGGFETGGAMKFDDAAAYEAYQTHPAHLALLSWMGQLIEAIEVDFPA